MGDVVRAEAMGKEALTYVHNNTVENDRPVEAGVTLHGGAGGLLRVENNTVSGYEMGIWVKATYTPHDIGRNVLTNNTDGVRVGYGDVSCVPRSDPRFLSLVEATLQDNVIENSAVGVNASAAHVTFQCKDPQGFYPVTALIVGRVHLTGNWIGNHTEDGVRVRSYVTNDTLQVEEPWANMTRNRIENNSHGVHLQGVAVGGTTYSVWANLTGNNTIANNTQYGVWIDGPTVDPTANHFWMWWNDVRGNSQYGIWVEGNPQPVWGGYFVAKCNWWAGTDNTPPNNLGPKDLSPVAPDQNEFGTGQPVGDYFHYRNWLDGPGTVLSTQCSGA